MEDNHPPDIEAAYEAESRANVSDENLTDDQKEFIWYMWQISSINNLNEVLGENIFCKTGIKWRVRGKESSLEIYEGDDDPQPGTVEVRIMQGTLDADHINNWVVVLEHIVDVVRNLSDDEFRELLNQFAADQTRDRLLSLLNVPDAIRLYWLDPKRRDGADDWWEYPDLDRVNFGELFHVRGHKATHGAFWD
jgi:hypothetical protein